MGQIADALKLLIENSDDLSSLPQLVAKVEDLEGQDEAYQARIDKLQEINRNYLAQIPIPGAEPKQTTPEVEEEPTLDDAKNYLIEALKEEK